MRVSAFNKSAKAKTVTAAEGQEGDAGAVLDLAPKVGAVSDERAANGGMMAGVKKAKDNHPKILPPAGPCFYPARSLRKIATDGTPRIFPGSGNFSQSPANQFPEATKLCWRKGATAGAKRSGGGAGRAGFWGRPVLRLAVCPLAVSLAGGRVDFTRRASTQAELSPGRRGVEPEKFLSRASIHLNDRTTDGQ